MPLFSTMPQVLPLGNHSFQLLWADTVLTITFKYLIEAHNIKPPFVIQHYQGKPIGERRFGYYDGTHYYSVRSHEVNHECVCQPIEVPDSAHVRPCAVNLFTNAVIEKKNGTLTIRPAT